MTTSNEAIAVAREIREKVYWPKDVNEADIPKIASIIQKHCAAKDAEIAQLKIDIAEIRRQHQQEANEWKTDEELTARVAGLEKALKAIVDEAWGISQKALAATNPKALTRLQELERRAKALDWYWKEYYRINVMFDPKECKVAIVYCSICCEYKETLFEAIESAMEKQK